MDVNSSFPRKCRKYFSEHWYLYYSLITDIVLGGGKGERRERKCHYSRELNYTRYETRVKDVSTDIREM